jgi:very-short-patch-repair endonuclease
VHRLHPSRHRATLIAERAKALREFSTLSERRLWSALSGGKVGVSFRRQAPVAGRFIIDFLAPAILLAVEVDGGVHQHTLRADARRDAKLRKLGYRVLRLDAELVMRDLEGAVARVRREVERLGG